VKVEFEIDDSLMPVSGVAVISCFGGDDGHPVIAAPHYGDVKPVEEIGLLTTALNQVRYTFIDKDYEFEDEADSDEDDEGED
jgi:hypothetical protein